MFGSDNSSYSPTTLSITTKVIAPNSAESSPASNPESTGDRSVAAEIPVDRPAPIPPATHTDANDAIFCDFPILITSASPS